MLRRWMQGSYGYGSPAVQIFRNYARGRANNTSPPSSSRNAAAAPAAGHDDADDDFDPSDTGRYEADFNQLAHSFRSHRQEEAHQREHIKQRTVGTKYFRKSGAAALTNFLTWSEKQQMRRLHASEPTEWSVERLAESFPADEATVAKVVRAQWAPKDAERVAKHDRAVRQAWQAFASGAAEFADMDAALREHLQKFEGRGALLVANTIPGETVTKVLPQLAIKEDFTKILTSCKQYKPAAQLAAPEEHTAQATTALPSLEGLVKPAPGVDTFLLDKLTPRSKSLLYRELDVTRQQRGADTGAAAGAGEQRTHNPFRDPSKSQHEDEDDGDAAALKDKGMASTYAMHGANTNKGQPPRLNDQVATISTNQEADANDLDYVTTNKYAVTAVTSSEEDMRRLSMPAIRDHIEIPKKLYKPGATYKLADCYYDDDGEFLYRVPGMTGRDVE